MSRKPKLTIGGEIAIPLILAYIEYNRKWFKNKLPKNVPIFWGTKKELGKRYMGTCFYTVPAIVILDELKSLPCVAETSLLHEMVHLEFPGSGHGKKFKMRMRELAKQGAFDGLL